jgi:hypothetical protein
MSDLDGRRLAQTSAEARAAFARVVGESLADSACAAAPLVGRGRRVALLAAMTVAGAACLGATGSLSYAASTLHAVAGVAHRVGTPQRAIVARGLTAGGDQYQAGYAFGDPEHNHDGPPGIVREATDAGPAAAPLLPEPAVGGSAKLVGTSIAFDEQVHLWISVIDPGNRPLLLTQHSKRGGSSVGRGLTGPQTKFIQYAVLVPRVIPMRLRVPSNLLEPGVRYRIRIVAIDPQGNRSQVLIPFSG